MVGRDRPDPGALAVITGFTFVWLRRAGLRSHAAQAVDERIARMRHAGLWQFKQLWSPAILVGQADKASRP